MPPRKPGPRLVTRTIADLRRLARDNRTTARELDDIADKLEVTDARETRPDPSKRKPRKRP